MRSDTILACVTLGVVAVMVTACSEAAPPAPPPTFVDSTGEAKSELVYPPGPYGVSIGTVIEDFDFVGYANASTTTATMQAISLGDFYNPHGLDASYQPGPEGDDRLFPTGSQYGAGQPKPTVLLVDVACVWCVPCNEEAQTILPAAHALYAPCGGQFLLDLHDSATPGTPATPKNLQNWTKAYKVNFPSAIDPSFKLDPLFVEQAFPQNFVIDTTTMTIVTAIAGAEYRYYCASDGSECTTNSDCTTPGDSCMQSTFWGAYESHLDKTRTGCTLK
jgi:hypothetical protein